MINNADETSNSNLSLMHPNNVTKKKAKHACILETLIIAIISMINPIAINHRNKLKHNDKWDVCKTDSMMKYHCKCNNIFEITYENEGNEIIHNKAVETNNNHMMK